MAHPTGESNGEALRLEFDRRIMLQKEPKIQAFILSWKGKHQNAESIYRSIASVCAQTRIVYSDPDPNFHFADDIVSIRRSNDLMFGDKFTACLDAFSGEIFLLIHADCHCASWPDLVQKCQQAFERFPDISIWSPVIDNCWPTAEFAELMRLPDSTLSIVANTDNVVFAVCREGIERLRKCDFQQNVHGWWAHVPALMEGYALHKFAVVDRSVDVNHSSVTGYLRDTAEVEGEEFLAHMSISEQALWRAVRRYYEPLPPTDSWLKRWLRARLEGSGVWERLKLAKSSLPGA